MKNKPVLEYADVQKILSAATATAVQNKLGGLYRHRR